MKALVGPLAIATLVAIAASLRPRLLLLVTRALVAGLAGIWVAALITGILIQLRQGPGPDSVRVDTPLHVPHQTLAHLALVATVWAWLGFTGVSVERAARQRWTYIFGLLPSSAVVVLVLVTSFTAYLGDGATTPAGYLRFRVLHTMLVPVIAAGTIGLWTYLAFRIVIVAPSGVVSDSP